MGGGCSVRATLSLSESGELLRNQWGFLWRFMGTLAAMWVFWGDFVVSRRPCANDHTVASDLTFCFSGEHH